MILINSSPKNSLKIFQPFLPIAVPMGIGYLLGIAEREGIDVKFIDEQVQENIFETISAYTKEMKPPYIFGFSVLTAAYKRSIFVSQKLKELYPDSIICFGGVHPTAMPENVLSYKHIDLVIRGEGEQIIPELYRCLKDRKDFTHLESLSYRRNGLVVHNKSAPIIEDLDRLPPFPHHLFTTKQYDRGFILSSRGCPHNCIFCSNRVTTGKKYRFRSAEAIIQEIEMLYHKYGKRNIGFFDDNLLVNKNRIYLLLEEIRKKNLHNKITLGCQARGDNVDYKLLKNMYEAGFRSIFFGIETASERLMEALKKGETVQQCIDAVRIAKKVGFQVSATFIYALPSETHKDRMDCVKLTKELDLELVRYNNATPYPGTELYKIAKREGRLNIEGLFENFNSVSTFIENPFNKIPFSYLPVGNSEKGIRQDILFSYLAFYLNMKKIRKLFFKPDETSGWFSTGERIIERFKKLPAILLLGVMLLVKFSEFFFLLLTKKKNSLSIVECVKLLVEHHSKKQLEEAL